MKKMQQKQKDNQVIDVLKRLTRRIEEATVDISSIKTDIKFSKLRLSGIEHNTEMMKVDMEKLKFDMESTNEELGDKIEGAENRINKRISNVSDLIAVEFGGKLQWHEKRIAKLEQAQQTA